MSSATRLVAWLLAVGLLALPIILVLNGWIASDRWPMQRLQITGEFRHVGDDQIREALLPHVGAGFFAVRLADVRESVASLPWVKQVEVRKRWPDLLEVAVVEHRVFARWGEDRLLSDEGVLFVVGPDGLPDGLPELEGPDTQIAEVVALYQEALHRFRAGGEHVRGLSLSPRGSWQLILENGTEIILGRQHPERRLTRFAGLLPQLVAAEGRPIKRADLRYTNGFALIWAEPESGAERSASAPNFSG